MMNKCKYCKDEKDHIINKNYSVELYISNKNITAFCGWCGGRATVPIKYCLCVGES